MMDKMTGKTVQAAIDEMMMQQGNGKSIRENAEKLVAAITAAQEPVAWVNVDAIRNIDNLGICSIFGSKSRTFVYSKPLYACPAPSSGEA